MNEITSAPYSPAFTTGYWKTRGGYKALVDRVLTSMVGYVMLGAWRVDCFWAPDGRRIPRGGSDPLDLDQNGER